MMLLSDIYDVTLKRVGRNEAKNGYIRPTICQSYMTHEDWNKVIKSQPLNSITYRGSIYGDTRCEKASVSHSDGKHYFEIKVVPSDYGSSSGLRCFFKAGLLPYGQVLPYTKSGPTYYGKSYYWFIPKHVSPFIVSPEYYQFYVDLDVGTMYIYHSGVLIDTITGISGEVFPYFGFSSNEDNGSFTADPCYINFGAADFTYPNLSNGKYWGD